MGQTRTPCGDGCLRASLAGTIGPWGIRSWAEGGCEIIRKRYRRGLTISQST